MIKRIFLLFKLQLNQGLGKLSFKKNRGRIFKTILLPTAIIILISFILHYLLDFANGVFGLTVDRDLMAFYLLITQVIALFVSTSSIISNLFFNKDSELLMSMPARHEEVFLSKLLLIYFYDLIMNFAMLVPMIIAVGFVSHAPFSFFIIGLLMVLLLPLMILFIAGIFATLVMFYIRLIRNKFYLTIFSIVVGVVGVFTVYMLFVASFGSIDFFGNIVESMEMVNNTIKSFGEGSLIYLKIADLMYFKNFWANFGILFASIIGLGLICYYTLKPVVFKFMFMNLENKNKAYHKKRVFKQRTQFMSIMTKDWNTLTRSSGYIVQFFLFALLMPFIVYIYNALLMTINVRTAGQQMVVGANFLIIILIALIGNTYVATAVSKEGGNFYIMKITPTSYTTQVKAKILLNMLITMCSIFITCVITFFTTKINIVEALATFICASLLAFGHACWSCEMDVNKPILDWYDSSEITKANKNVTNSLFSGLIIGIAVGILAIMMFYSAGTVVTWILLLLLSVTFAIYRLYLFHIRLDYLFSKIEL